MELGTWNFITFMISSGHIKIPLRGQKKRDLSYYWAKHPAQMSTDLFHSYDS